MLVKSLSLNDYRNYEKYALDFNPNLNIIIGKNGIGKTNILESIIVISNSKSFRTINDKDLIKKNQEYLKIELESDEDTYKVVINHKNKFLYINERLINKSSEFIGKLNAILFKPSDLYLFVTSPAERRKILDLELCKVNKKYLLALSKYNSLLKDKNKILKELEIDEQLLKIINESMIPQIETIILEREKFFNYLNQKISSYYQQITNTNSTIQIAYKKCCELKDIEQSLIEADQKDHLYQYASFGPHKEDYYFKLDEYELNTIASQGQSRMALIAYKFALIDFIKETTKQVPIILLDDIMSELDKENQERLLQALPSDAQIIITNTDINNLFINKEYKLIELKEDLYV